MDEPWCWWYLIVGFFFRHISTTYCLVVLIWNGQQKNSYKFFLFPGVCYALSLQVFKEFLVTECRAYHGLHDQERSTRISIHRCNLRWGQDKDMQREYVLTVNDGRNEALLPSQEHDFFGGQRHLSCRLALLPRTNLIGVLLARHAKKWISILIENTKSTTNEKQCGNSTASLLYSNKNTSDAHISVCVCSVSHFFQKKSVFFSNSLPVSRWLISNQNIVDGNVYKLDKESNETHNQKADSGGPGNGHEFFSVGLGALFDQVHGVFGELLEGFDQHLVETFLFCGHDWRMNERTLYENSKKIWWKQKKKRQKVSCCWENLQEKKAL